MLDHLDASSLRRWAVVARAALAARRAEIDALNVYPVPDGDTGTNMYLTLDQALDALRTDHESRGIAGDAGFSAEVNGMSRATLLSARGNSGVILSQLVRGMAEGLDAVTRDEDRDGVALADGMQRAAQRARDSVLHPQRGTILTVADAAADAASEVAEGGGDLAAVTAAAVEAAKAALAATPDQLQVLADAGVVDAGGAGYLLFVEALDRVVRDSSRLDGFLVDEFTLNPTLERRAEWSRPVVDRPQVSPAAATSGPAYEVMYRLHPVSEDHVVALRAALDPHGDSIVVSQADDTARVHVHTDDIGAVLEAAFDIGRPEAVSVAVLDAAGLGVPTVGMSVVACAAGPGIADLFAQVGAITVASGPAHRASAGELLEAVRRAGTADVILLPNDRDTRLAADAAAQAAGQDGQTVHVVASSTAVQGIAALAVYEPGTSASRNVVAMTRAAAATRHGGVTVAAKAGLTSGGPCEIGDILGVVGGDITVVGQSFEEVAVQVVGSAIGGAAELVTLVVGRDAPAGVVDHLQHWLASEHRGVEVEVVEGGQSHYPLLVGAE